MHPDFFCAWHRDHSLADTSHLAMEPRLRLPLRETVSQLKVFCMRTVAVMAVASPKAHARAAPVHVSYSLSALLARGYVHAADRLQIPVIGLYAGYTNEVRFEVLYSDDSSQMVPVTISTSAYVDNVDSRRVFDSPVTLTRREAGRQLGFDFFMDHC
jgi:hypothetical protein